MPLCKYCYEHFGSDKEVSKHIESCSKNPYQNKEKAAKLKEEKVEEEEKSKAKKKK